MLVLIEETSSVSDNWNLSDEDYQKIYIDDSYADYLSNNDEGLAFPINWVLNFQGNGTVIARNELV